MGSASIAFFFHFFFFLFFFRFFSAGKMRIIFLFLFLSCIILESNSIHGKTVSGVRERESDASSASRNLKERKNGFNWIQWIQNGFNFHNISISIIPNPDPDSGLVEIATAIATGIGKGIEESFALTLAILMSHVRGFLEFDKVLREGPPMQYICNTTLDCMRNAPLNDEHEISNVTDPVSEHQPEA